MSVTISDETTNPLLVTDGQSLAAYKGVSVADNNPLDGHGNGFDHAVANSQSALGLNYYFYPTVTNLGSITDPNGGGTWNAMTDTFTESGLVAGDPTFATDLLSRFLCDPRSSQTDRASPRRQASRLPMGPMRQLTLLLSL